MPDHTILIVGAGPTGLMCALECQRHGLDFAIIERRPGPSEHSKALGIWSGTLEALSPHGLTQRFLDSAVKLKAVRFADRGNVLAKFDSSEGVDSLYPTPIILPQNETETLLIEKLEAAGGRVERELELVYLEQDDEQVTATLKDRDGNETTRTCRFLVGCDGSRSATRNLAGIEFPGHTEAATFLLYDGPIEGHHLEHELMACWSGEGAVLVLPIKPGLYRLICQRERGEDLSPPNREELQEQVDHNAPKGWKLGEPVWTSAFRISERIAEQFREKRVFLCGDAAHIHSPAGGQGMNTGMQDAVNLVWKLAMLSKVKEPERWLESYHTERQPVARATMKGAADKLHFGLAQGLLARVIKDLAVSTVFQSASFRKHLAFELSELGIFYQESPLIAEDAWGYSPGGFHPGIRVRSTPVQRPDGGTEELWEAFMHSDFTLTFFSGANESNASELWVRLLEALKECPDAGLRAVAIWQQDQVPEGVPGDRHYLDPQGSAHTRFGMHGSGWYLVRPDQYVGARSSPVCFDTLSSVLHLYFQ